MKHATHAAPHRHLVIGLLILCTLAILPDARPARATEILTVGHIVKGDNLLDDQVVTYTVQVPSNKQIIVGAINIDAIQVPNDAGEAPRITVDCPNTSSPQQRSPSNGQASDSETVYCTPRSANGSDVTVTISVRGRSSTPVNYGVFVQRIDQATVTSFNGLILSGVELNARSVKIYSIPNTNSNLKKRNLSFSPSATSRAAAMLYREDGDLRCGTLKPRTCEVYDSDWPSYYLLVINAGDADFTYDVRFTTP